MTVGILGLGLIGGSLAKAYKEGGHRVLAYDADPSVTDFAMMANAADGVLNRETIGSCDLILLAVYPAACISWLEEMSPLIAPNATVIDCCGTKQQICAVAFPLAERYGWRFVGGHPMAGTHFSGFKHSRGNLFRGAPMVLIPPKFDDMRLLEEICELLAPLQFGRFSITTAEKHDQMIAFTSQLAHVVSNAYVKSPTATEQKGFSAGSYRDLTRVAWLNAPMWTELFLDNRQFLIEEIDHLIQSLSEYRAALSDYDAETLCRLLEEGKQRKEEVG